MFSITETTGRILNALGPGYERFGVEVNRAAADIAVRRGITILPEREIAENYACKFDAIIVSDVFEHLVKPTTTMRLLAERLHPGGRVLIVTGLADAIELRGWTGEHWYFRLCGHLQMLSLRQSRIWLAATLGLELRSVTRMSHYKRSFLYFARQMVQAKLYHVFRTKPQSWTASLLRKVPRLNRAAHWTNLPVTNQLDDHVVAVLENV